MKSELFFTAISTLSAIFLVRCSSEVLIEMKPLEFSTSTLKEVMATVEILYKLTPEKIKQMKDSLLFEDYNSEQMSKFFPGRAESSPENLLFYLPKGKNVSDFLDFTFPNTKSEENGEFTVSSGYFADDTSDFCRSTLPIRNTCTLSISLTKLQDLLDKKFTYEVYTGKLIRQKGFLMTKEQILPKTIGWNIVFHSPESNIHVYIPVEIDVETFLEQRFKVAAFPSFSVEGFILEIFKDFKRKEDSNIQKVSWLKIWNLIKEKMAQMYTLEISTKEIDGIHVSHLEKFYANFVIIEKKIKSKRESLMNFFESFSNTLASFSLNPLQNLNSKEKYFYALMASSLNNSLCKMFLSSLMKNRNFEIVQISEVEFYSLLDKKLRKLILQMSVEFGDLSPPSADSPFILKGNTFSIFQFPTIQGEVLLTDKQKIRKYVDYVARLINPKVFPFKSRAFFSKLNNDFWSLFWKKETIENFETYLKNNSVNNNIKNKSEEKDIRCKKIIFKTSLFLFIGGLGIFAVDFLKKRANSMIG